MTSLDQYIAFGLMSKDPLRKIVEDYFAPYLYLGYYNPLTRFFENHHYVFREVVLLGDHQVLQPRAFKNKDNLELLECVLGFKKKIEDWRSEKNNFADEASQKIARILIDNFFVNFADNKTALKIAKEYRDFILEGVKLFKAFESEFPETSKVVQNYLELILLYYGDNNDEKVIDVCKRLKELIYSGETCDSIDSIVLTYARDAVFLFECEIYKRRAFSTSSCKEQDVQQAYNLLAKALNGSKQSELMSGISEILEKNYDNTNGKYNVSNIREEVSVYLVELVSISKDFDLLCLYEEFLGCFEKAKEESIQKRVKEIKEKKANLVRKIQELRENN